MKRILAVALLLVSFTSAALADGPGQKPPGARTATIPHEVGVVRLADGAGGPPIKGAAQTPLGGVVLLADGAGQKPPTRGTATNPAARNVAA